jgi:glycerophosphoryl diester phosphodiesterase
MLTIGHRGASGYCPENTIESFQKALQLQVAGIELDVHLSADGVPMVIHDDTLERTTSQKGKVAHYTSLELQQWTIPTLEQVIVLIHKQCWINIEIKDSQATSAVVNLLENFIATQNWNYNDFQISSFDWTVLEEIATRNPNFFLGVLTEKSLQEALQFALSIKAKSINPKFSLLTVEKVTLLHENGLFVFPWTVNTVHDIEAMKGLKVDGIISDFPDKI